MENIELKTGDLLFSKSNYHGLQKIEVERLTNTQIVLEGYDTKLRKPFYNGIAAIGSKGFGNTYYYLPTPELEKEYQRQFNDRFIRAFKWSKISNDDMQSAVDLLKSLKQQ